MGLGGKGDTMNNKSSKDNKHISIDPWGSSTIEDYDDLFTQFGISKFEHFLPNISNPHYLMRRGIIFGHRGYQSILEAINSKSPFSVLSGFMPTGDPHIGHKMVFDEIVWHQKQGAKAYGLIADLEAHAARKLSWDEIDGHAKNYVLALLASGFNLETGEVYRQSENKQVRDLAFELGIETNFSEMQSIYGFSGNTELSHIQSVLTQAADILYPQLDHPQPTVIPVGPDQDPHLRLTRDLASRLRLFSVTKAYASFEADPMELEYLETAFDKLSPTKTPLHCNDVADWIENENKPSEVLTTITNKLKEASKEEFYPRVRVINHRATSDLFKKLESRISENKKTYKQHIDVFDTSHDEIDNMVREFEIEHGGYGFYPPLSLYHRFMSGLTGGKMSSSIPDSHISLFEDPESGYQKVKQSTTGGRESAKLQRELGGEADKCPVYELYAYLLAQDDDSYAQRVYEECTNGTRLCGDCKEEAANLMREFLKDYQQKIKEVEPLLEKLNFNISNPEESS